jgi:hypothetical protein
MSTMLANMLVNMFETMSNLLPLYLDRTTMERTWWIQKVNRKTFDKKSCISHYTPFGAAFKVSEVAANNYYNSRTMVDRIRQKYLVTFFIS